MNERIEGLWWKARIGYNNQNCDPEVLAKFAELIVEECIDQVAGTRIVGQLSGDEFAELTESANNKYKQWNNALTIATMNVRDHFGVEE